MPSETFSDASRVMISNAKAKYGMLPAERERELIQLWRDNSDQRAINELVMSHMPLMVSLVHKLSGYGMPSDDMLGQAMQGMVRAIERFDPSRGFRLNTFARNWLYDSMMSYVMANRSILKPPQNAASRILFFHLPRSRKALQLYGSLSRDDAERIREYLVENVPRAQDLTVEQILENDSFRNMSFVSVDAPIHEGNDTSILSNIPDKNLTPIDDDLIARDEISSMTRLLHQAIANVLNPRQTQVFVGRMMATPVVTLADLGKDLGISKERVRQIEERTFELVQAEMKALVMDRAMDAKRMSEKHLIATMEKQKRLASKSAQRVREL